MRNIKKPHTIIVFQHQGRTQTIGRPGWLPAKSHNGASVEGILQAHGVTGPVTIRHHQAVMFGKPGKVAAVLRHVVA